MFKCLLVIASLILSTLAKDPPPDNQWLTLYGQEPIVIARGGLSGVFPESSSFANQMALVSSLSNTVLYCNLQLTKDGIGICLSNLKLDNSTNIALLYPKGQKTYNNNGKDIKGWFAFDYNSDELFSKVTLIQNTLSRSSSFDEVLPISAVEDVAGIKPYQFWLSVQYDSFFKQHNLSSLSYVQKALRFLRINYISSPEIGFLKALNGNVNKGRTKLIFQFLGADEFEPTTLQTYGSLAQDLASIKSFASGILVPKEYMWPLNKNKYLEAPTTLVVDAHKEGLEVYASGFANDMVSAYNYSYDPISEYLQFVDNDQFSVDGVLSDFAPTASEAIACFSSYKNDGKPKKGKQTLIISSNGASGIYPGCTDLAYKQAVDDGADIIDCSVQISKDGVPFCFDAADLVASSTVMAAFMPRSSTIPEIQADAGIFSFDLTWSEIQSVKPQIKNPFLVSSAIERNPAYKFSGKFFTLAEFLDFAKARAVTGVMINIQNAAYLASKKGLDIVGAVTVALSNATFDKQSTQRVFIRSDDTSVLSKFKSVPTYTRVLTIEEKIDDAPKHPLEEIKKFADAVAIPRASIVKTANYFTNGMTKVVEEMHAANISVFVYVLRNEFVTLAFDYFSDPMMEMATYVDSIRVDGIITEYPKTASKYMKCPCRVSEQTNKAQYTIMPPQIGSMIDLIPAEIKPPAEAPNPPLEVADVVDPPLPPVTNVSTARPADGPAASGRSSAVSNVASVFVSIVSMAVLSLLSVV